MNIRMISGYFRICIKDSLDIDNLSKTGYASGLDFFFVFSLFFLDFSKSL